LIDFRFNTTMDVDIARSDTLQAQLNSSTIIVSNGSRCNGRYVHFIQLNEHRPRYISVVDLFTHMATSMLLPFHCVNILNTHQLNRIAFLGDLYLCMICAHRYNQRMFILKVDWPKQKIAVLDDIKIDDGISIKAFLQNNCISTVYKGTRRLSIRSILDFRNPIREVEVRNNDETYWALHFFNDNVYALVGRDKTIVSTKRIAKIDVFTGNVAYLEIENWRDMQGPVKYRWLTIKFTCLISPSFRLQVLQRNVGKEF